MGKCIVCGTELTKNDFLMCCENSPASAQNLPSAEELSLDKGIDLYVCQCSGCGLVQLDCEPVSYYRDVIRAGGYSAETANLRRRQYSLFIEKCGLEGGKIIEVGCGQGEFLQTLTEFPVQAFGIEHKPELVKIAVDKGLSVTEGFAETPETVFQGGPFDAFVSFNFLEHQPRPNDMLRCIYNNLKPGGYGLVTVPCIEYVIESDAFYEFIHDHIACYSAETVRFLLEKNGFEVIYLQRERDIVTVIVRKREHINVSGLKKNSEILAWQMQEFVRSRRENGKSIAVWGASHQGFTAISSTGVESGIQYIIDSAPFKQGKYAPASHVPIVSPEYFLENPVDSILIIAPGYTKEIAGIIRQKYGNDVEINALVTNSIEKVK